MRRFFSGALLVLLTLISITVCAQTASIRGFVYEKESGEPVIFTNVYLKGTIYGAATDVDGYFVISKVPPGDYQLTVTSLGYDTLLIPVSLKANQIIDKQLYLNQSSVTLEVFNVSASREEAKTTTKTSVVKVTPKQIKSIPMVGEPDLAQYLQVLPGVIFTGDQGGQLYIRGGSPIQNKVILDGMIVYNPFHSIGLFSVFETEILRNAEIYTGGFGAEYGGRISSIMDITTRDGNKKRHSGILGASSFGARVLVEGPLKKQKENGSSISYILSAKNSYLKQSSELFYNYIDTSGLPFNYRDLYGKISFNGLSGSKVNFFGYNYTDKVNYKAISDFHWDSWGAGTNFVVLPSGSPMLIKGNFAYSSYKIALEDKVSLPRQSEISGFNMGLNFTNINGKNEVIYGIEMLGFNTDFNFYNSLNRLIQQEENTTELAGFVKTKFITKNGKLIIEPSFRLQWYASLSNMSPEPRLAFKYNATDYLRFKLAAGFYSQNLIAANSDRDIVNLFYGFLSGPENLQDEFDGEVVTHKLQKAEHLIAGIEIDPIRHMTVNIEGYYKNFSQLTNINRNKIFDDIPEYSDKPDYLRKDFVIETGDAYGFDISVKYDYRRFYLWAVYSLGYVHRYDGIITYVPHYDRRHNINVTGSTVLGKNTDWELNVRWNLGSGFPFTLTAGFYEYLDFSNGINTDYVHENGALGIIYGELNKGRLPYYHRLDLTVKKTFALGKNKKLETHASITNVYNRDNIFYQDRVTGEKVYQLPIMPSMGMIFHF